MAYKPLEKLLPRSGYSVYKLVRMAANRATELADGMPRLIKNATSEKTATIALDEIIAGKVQLKEVVDQLTKEGKAPKNVQQVQQKDNDPQAEEEKVAV